LNQPIEKYARQIGFIFPKFRGENNTYHPPLFFGAATKTAASQFLFGGKTTETFNYPDIWGWKSQKQDSQQHRRRIQLCYVNDSPQETAVLPAILW